MNEVSKAQQHSLLKQNYREINIYYSILPLFVRKMIDFKDTRPVEFVGIVKSIGTD